MRANQLVPLIVASALFIENMDNALLSTALPTIAADLKVDPLSLKLALTSYLISLAVFIPISGWVADRIGARTTFICAIMVFMAASVSCAFNNSLGTFVASRTVQGIGGAMMVPVGRLIILRTVSRHELVDALAYLTVPALIGPVIGPPVGGFITTYLSWHWIFLLNVPVGLVGIALALRYFDNVKGETVTPLDIGGFAISSTAIFCLMTGLSMFGRSILPNWLCAVMLVVGLVAGWIYVRHARRHPAPLIDLSLLAIPTFRYAIISGAIFRIGISATPFLLPLMLQLLFGLDALQSGSLTFAMALGALTMKTLAARILRRFGFRRVLLVNAVLSGLAIAAVGFITPMTPWPGIFALLLVGGFLRSLQFTSYNAVTYADVPAAQMSRATSLASTLQNASLAVGIAVGAALVEIASAWRGGALVREDFTVAFVITGVFAALAAIIVARLPPDAGHNLVAKPIEPASEGVTSGARP
jgi:EmrB/QacA subfamily drug resistance transporter